MTIAHSPTSRVNEAVRKFPCSSMTLASGAWTCWGACLDMLENRWIVFGEVGLFLNNAGLALPDLFIQDRDGAGVGRNIGCCYIQHSVCFLYSFATLVSCRGIVMTDGAYRRARGGGANENTQGWHVSTRTRDVRCERIRFRGKTWLLCTPSTSSTAHTPGEDKRTLQSSEFVNGTSPVDC